MPTERASGARIASRPCSLAALGVAAPAARAQPVQDGFPGRRRQRSGRRKSKRLLARGADPDTVDRNGDPVLVDRRARRQRRRRSTSCSRRAPTSTRGTAFGDTRADGGGARRPPRPRQEAARARRRRESAGLDALIYAATGGHDEVVRYLLAEGADIDAASPNGTTALMMAAREGRASTVDLLIARGADVNHRNENGASALDWAQRGKDPAMVERLRRAGAR